MAGAPIQDHPLGEQELIVDEGSANSKYEGNIDHTGTPIQVAVSTPI